MISCSPNLDHMFHYLHKYYKYAAEKRLMENKYVGLLILGVVSIFFALVISFNMALENIVTSTCVHGPECPMYANLATQKIISYSLIGLLILVGAFVTFFMKEKAPSSETRKVLREEEKKKVLENLDEEEKRVMELVLANQGSIYQSDLLKETAYTKVKVTRLLDKLEGRGLVERKRRGMTNIIVLR